MNNFVIDTPDNFWQIRWLDKYMEGHKGFIAGGCFKNILSNLNIEIRRYAHSRKREKRYG